MSIRDPIIKYHFDDVYGSYARFYYKTPGSFERYGTTPLEDWLYLLMLKIQREAFEMMKNALEVLPEERQREIRYNRKELGRFSSRCQTNLEECFIRAFRDCLEKDPVAKNDPRAEFCSVGHPLYYCELRSQLLREGNRFVRFIIEQNQAASPKKGILHRIKAKVLSAK